jgi:hypothetical protein
MNRKKTPFSRGSMLATALLSLCTFNCSETNTHRTAIPDECLLGEWKLVENGITKSFSFKEDQTGKEIQSATDIRPFKWQRSDKQITIVYTEDPAERAWGFTLDCGLEELKIFGLSYRK